MNFTQKISIQIERLPFDLTFGYVELNINKEEYQTAAKVLERLQKKGVIRKLSKGVFYKTQNSVFGELKPNNEEQLRPYLFKDGKRIAYVTGPFLYNQLGLTLQLAFRIKIASQSKRIYIDRGSIKATPVKSYAEVTDENFELLGFLDAMKDLRIIPDVDTKSAIKIFCQIIESLNEVQIRELIKYALLYPPRVRALLGAILEQLNKSDSTKKLKDSLNPLSVYKLGIRQDELTTKNSWRIL